MLPAIHSHLSHKRVHDANLPHESRGKIGFVFVSRQKDFAARWVSELCSHFVSVHFFTISYFYLFLFFLFFFLFLFSSKISTRSSAVRATTSKLWGESVVVTNTRSIVRDIRELLSIGIARIDRCLERRPANAATFTSTRCIFTR